MAEIEAAMPPAEATLNMDPSPPAGQDPIPIPLPTPAEAELSISNRKGKGRQRLLRGLQRISSSPSLTNLQRPRSSSAPYKLSTRSTLSCVSLAVDGPVQTPRNHTPGTTTPIAPSPLSIPTSWTAQETPSGGFPFNDISESQLAPRRVESPLSGLLNGTAALPVEIQNSLRPEKNIKVKSGTVSPPIKPAFRFRFWDSLPHEMQIHIFSFLRPKELVQASRTSRLFYRLCFDGQLWISIDASEFYRTIPAESLARIISVAGPFIRDLNLRGCVQVEHYKRAEVLVKACTNLRNASLEGCRNFQRKSLHGLIENNATLVSLNLMGLTAVSNKCCKLISEFCPQLESICVSWCQKLDHKGIKAIVDGCKGLKDLRAGEVRGFNDVELAQSIFEINSLERLVLGGCSELNDEFLKVMIHGTDPEIDVLTNIPMVPPRKLRHLDLSRCPRLTDDGIKALSKLTPNLEGLQLSRCKTLTDDALQPILASTPCLTHLDLEELSALTNSFLSEHLAKAPCASRLAHLSLSYCENIGDAGMLPVFQNCVGLRTVDLDNTQITDLTLTGAASMVSARSIRAENSHTRPSITLQLAVYDCPNVTWAGIREVLFRNTQFRPSDTPTDDVISMTYPTQCISLKCFYGFQMTVDEHQKRVLRGDLQAASRLERKWADYMQATEEAVLQGSGNRRRRRRAREALALHRDEEDGLRQRARTLGGCFMM